MIQLNSSIEGKHFERGELEALLSGYGFEVGGGWDYDHAYFDYVFQKTPYYDVLRIPVAVRSGDFEQASAKLVCGMPFLIRHCYENGIDEDKDALFGIGGGPLNQFQKPTDPDAPVSEKLVVQGVELLRSIETQLQ